MDEPTDAPKTVSLTKREQDVLEMAALGLTNREVGERLHVSVHAVKFHLASVYRKLKVANRTEAVVAYLKMQSSLHQAEI
jgi:LuxR family transcriptional regulator, regulator of acetate metabolism